MDLEDDAGLAESRKTIPECTVVMNAGTTGIDSSIII